MMLAHLGAVEGFVIALAILAATLVVTLGIAAWAVTNKDNKGDDN